MFERLPIRVHATQSASDLVDSRGGRGTGRATCSKMHEILEKMLWINVWINLS